MFLEVPGAKIFATRSGPRDGAVILAIGGWIGSSELWMEPLAQLSDSYVTIAYDHRGSGLTVCDPSSITFENLVSDAIAVLDALGIRRCVLAAESAGAQTAIAVAARFPHRVSHMVVVDGMYSRGVAVDNDPFLQGLRTNYPATIERFVQLCIVEPESEHVKEWGRKILARAGQDAAIALRVVGSTTDVTTELGQIKQPTLVLHGELDRIVQLEQARALASTLPDAELQVLQQAGHVPTLTRPVQVAEAIRDFLRRREA
jgi:pimeloyl-ACP methyl ester carboxylesterase